MCVKQLSKIMGWKQQVWLIIPLIYPKGVINIFENDC